MMTTLQWYVLRVGTNRETRLRRQLLSRIQTQDLKEMIPQLLVVTEKQTEIKAGKRRSVERKVYPGYIMAQIQTDEDGKIPAEVWHLIRDTPGSIRFVGHNPDEPDKPVPLGPEEVEKMLQQVARVSAEEEGQVSIDFEVGETVMIREGSFENFEGTVEELQPEKGMVKVSIMVFGRPTPIDFEVWKVGKVEK
ncbi:MAG: transcription termination/antitermination protein NusG [Planctomycetota bacterium]